MTGRSLIALRRCLHSDVCPGHYYLMRRSSRAMHIPSEAHLHSTYEWGNTSRCTCALARISHANCTERTAWRAASVYRCRPMQIWFMYRTSLWNAFARTSSFHGLRVCLRSPLYTSQRVDQRDTPSLEEHAPRRTNAPVYKGYLQTWSFEWREGRSPRASAKITYTTKKDRARRIFAATEKVLIRPSVQ